ncbi:MAG: VWA domain-containing protein, partial [Blastocatellia bacterium]
PGRKLLFFLSEGLIVDQRDREIQTRVNRVIDVAARAGIIFYTLDVRGLAVAGPEAADDVYPSLAASDLDNNFNQASAMDVATEESFEFLKPMRALAYDSGGRPLINNNALEKNLKQAINEYQNYYLVAWQPEEFEPGKTKFRRIEVKVKDRPELRVLVRSGFFNNPVPTSDTKDNKAEKNKDAAKAEAGLVEDTLKAAVRAPYERRELPFSVYPVFKNEANGGSAVTVNIEVASLVNSPANAEQPNQEFDLVYTVLDLNGKLITSDGKTLKFAQAPGVSANLIQQFTVPLSPGTYQIRVGARDAVGRISTSFEWVETPVLAPGKMALSSLLLSERKAKAAATEEPLLNIERRFARSSRLLLQVFIYNAARKSAVAQPDVTMEIDVLRKGVSVLNAPQHPVSVEGAND